MADGHLKETAAHRAVRQYDVHLRLPVVGDLELPPVEHLAWYLGVAALAVLEIIEWPVAVVLAVGKALADNRHSKALMEFGEALEEGA